MVRVERWFTISKLSGGDHIACTQVPSDPAKGASSLLVNQAAIVNATKAAAIANDCGIIDFNGMFGSYANMVANGWAAGDQVHPNMAGQQQMLNLVQSVVMAA